MASDKWENVGLSIQSSLKELVEFQRESLRELKEIRSEVASIGVKSIFGILMGSVAFFTALVALVKNG